MAKIFLFLSVFWLHPFYVSVTTIEQSKDKTSLEITSRIFYDDLEAALKEEFGGKIDLKNPSQKEKNNELIKKYFERNFLLKLNNQIVKADYLGFNIEGEAAWCFLEVENAKNIKTLETVNRLLYRSFKEQIHIYHINLNGKKESTKIQNPDVKAIFEF